MLEHDMFSLRKVSLPASVVDQNIHMAKVSPNIFVRPTRFFHLAYVTNVTSSLCTSILALKFDLFKAVFCSRNIYKRQLCSSTCKCNGLPCAQSSRSS